MKRFVLGITGGIATGKTAVLNELKRLGVPTLSSDELAHRCLRPGHPVHRKIRDRFGFVDRRRLGQIVFSDPKERRWLEKQIHPWVIRQLKAFIRRHRGVIALDIPLLFEARLENLVDGTVVVWSSQKRQISRIKRRDGLPLESALLRIRTQMPLTDKRRRADYTIENNRDLMALKEKSKALLTTVLSRV